MHPRNISTAVFCVLIGIINALPISNTALEEVSNMASQPCPNFPASTDSMAGLADFLIGELQIELLELADTTENTLRTINQWTSLVDSGKKQRLLDTLKTLQLPAHEHDLLSSEVNSKLRVLEQLSNYAYFLLKQENDAAYDAYGMNGTALLRKISNKISRSMCILRGLVRLSGDEVKNYVLQDVDGHLIPLETMNAAVPAMKRAVVSIAVNMMFQTLKQIEVHLETGSVLMPANV